MNQGVESVSIVVKVHIIVYYLQQPRRLLPFSPTGWRRSSLPWCCVRFFWQVHAALADAPNTSRARTHARTHVGGRGARG